MAPSFSGKRIEDIDGGEILEKEYDLFGLVDRASKFEKEIEGEVIEEGLGYKIVRKKDEKTPIYVVSLPELDEKEKKILKTIENKAIAEITIDPESILDPEKKKKVFLNEVMKLVDSNSKGIPQHKRRELAELIVQDMVGYGLLEPLLLDDALEEVMLVGTKKSVYVYHRKHGMCKTNIIFDEDEEALGIIDRIARSIGRRVDLSAPLLDARLSDGSRVNATVRPVSLDGPSLTIRKFKADPLTVVDIINFGTLTPELASFLWLAVDGYGAKPANILVSGGTGSGKTTTLNCLGLFIPSADRVITIEDTAELQLPLEHWVRLETRPPNIEGRGEVNMDMLLKNTLRMRPDRIIVGEVRGGEAKTLLASMNTGQSGCLGTIHANTAKETITRLSSAPMSVPVVMIPSLNLILMQNKFTYKGKTVRRITEIAEVTGIEDGRIQMNIIFEWDPKDDKVKPTGTPSILKARLAELRGVKLSEVEEELNRRKEVLEYLIREGLRGIKDVGHVVNEYYTTPEKLLAKFSGEKEDKETKKETKKGAYSFLEDIIGDESSTEQMEEVIEREPSHKVVRIGAEKNLRYIIPLPPLSKKEKALLRDIEKQAISDIEVDPTTLKNKEAARELFTTKILEIMEKKYTSIGPSKRKDVANMIALDMTGYGILEYLLADDSLEEIMMVGTKKPIYVNHRKYGTCKTNLSFDTEDDAVRIIEKIASSVGRRIDRSTPLLDARLSDGSRVNATVRPISLAGPTLTIRKFRKDPLTVVNLINFRTLNSEVSAYLWLVAEGLAIKPGNILVAGGSGSGKTTTLNCLCSFIPSTDRVITIEDTAELRLPIEHCVRLETRPPNVEGEGEVTMDDLVKNTLRMRPDRIIVGEVRGEEARTLFTAMNTGHDGCMGTLHSNSARETVTRLTNPPMNVPSIMLPALDLILMENKIYHEGATLRRITEVAEVGGVEKDRVLLNNVYEWDPRQDDLKPTGTPSILKQKIARLKGISMEEFNEEMRRRKAVLEWMLGHDITHIAEVAKVFNRYYTNPEEMLTEIGGLR
ncbi:MAG: CpaF family protein [Candidatus Hydrothermarchaeales archaeon]